MNFKTLYALYFTLVVSVVFTIGATVISKDFRESFKESFDEGVNRGLAIDDTLGNKKHYGVWRGYMIPNNIKVNSNSIDTFGELSPNKALVTVSAKILDVSVRNYKILPQAFRYYCVLEVVFSLIVCGLLIYLLVLLYKLFRRMQKSLRARKVFSMEVVKVLRSLGIVLILIELLSIVFYYFHNKAAQIVLAPYGYEVDYFIEIEYITIIFGVALLLVSEFLKIGYKIQEEQSLTV